MRIISTVPSQTELLADLGLDKEVVGITKFCVHPRHWHLAKTKIGGTKTLNVPLIKELAPDIIIANKEENVREQIAEISRFCEVLVYDIKNPHDNLDLISQLSQYTSTRMTGIRLRSDLKHALNAVTAKTNKSAAYLIWKDPYMTVGNDTYIHALMELCGFQNVFQSETRYPETTLEDIKERNPDCLLLSSEPFPFKQKHIEDIRTVLPDTKIYLVDGEAFSWYGTRLIKKVEYLTDLMNTINVVNA